MEILDCIRKRRSVRKYKNDLPKDEAIDALLEAARWAPSGLNNQPWRFLVIKDPVQKKGVSEFTKYHNVIKEAPLVIIVCMDKSASYHREKDLMGIGACIQNMLLQAHALGLGACWLGEILNKKEEVKRYARLDDNLELMAVITVGYPDEEAGKGSRKPLKSLMINA